MNVSLTQKQPGHGAIGGVSVKLVVGIFFTLLGVLMTLDNFEVAEADRFLAYWPVVFIAIGLVKLGDRRGKLPAFIAIAAGVLLLPFSTDWVRTDIFDFWPVALIVAGVAIVAHAFGFRVPAFSGESSSTIWAMFSMRKEAVDARSYAGGRIIAFMGGCELDLTKAAMEQGPAELEVIVIWGGVEIKVPDGWEVSGNTVPIMGAAEIKTKSKPGGPKLIVNGLAIMGGIDIKSVAAVAI
jgi:predicted membrane protein